MPVQTDELARQIQEMNARLGDVIDTIHSEGTALRGEIGSLRTDIGKINTSLAWMKGISGIVGASLVGMGVIIYQAGERTGQMAQAIASLQKASDELRHDSKTRDSEVADAIVESRKITEDVRKSMKGQGEDMSRIQTTLDRLVDSVSHLQPPFRPR